MSHLGRMVIGGVDGNNSNPATSTSRSADSTQGLTSDRPSDRPQKLSPDCANEFRGVGGVGLAAFLRHIYVNLTGAARERVAYYVALGKLRQAILVRVVHHVADVRACKLEENPRLLEDTIQFIDYRRPRGDSLAWQGFALAGKGPRKGDCDPVPAIVCNRGLGRRTKARKLASSGSPSSILHG